MASEAQIQANRLNARKSTGPRTDEGKATASQNAVKHGLLARQAVIRGEDPGEFEFYRDEMLGELAPARPAVGRIDLATTGPDAREADTSNEPNFPPFSPKNGIRAKKRRPTKRARGKAGAIGQI